MRNALVGVTIISAIIFWAPATTEAQVPPQPNPTFGNFEVGLPGLEKEGAKKGQSIDAFVKGGSPFVKFFGSVARVFTGIIVAIGFIVIIAGGYVYMTAGGSGDRIGTAKTMIGSAILGIVLALIAFTILNAISPQFTNPIEPTI